MTRCYDRSRADQELEGRSTVCAVPEKLPLVLEDLADTAQAGSNPGV